jgi:hypothetical protein
MRGSIRRTLSLKAVLSAVTMGGGVRAGAAATIQMSRRNPGNPASVAVGTSGSTRLRIGPPTASARTIPLRICAIASAGVTPVSWTSPALTACSAGPPPR